MTGHCPPVVPLNYRKTSWPSRRLFENWARRELFPSAFSNVNAFNAKSPETGLVYLVWLQNPFLNWAIRPLLWWIRLSPPSLPSQMAVCHLVFRTSLQQGLCFSCWKLESWEFPDFGGRVRRKRKWVAYQNCSVLVPKWGFMEGGSPEVSRKERCCFIWNVFLPHSVPQ